MATDLEKLVVQLSADIKGYEREMQKAMGVTNRQARAIENRFRTMNRSLDGIGRNAARSLIAPLTGIGAALSVREVLRYADAWTAAKNSLAVAGVIGENQAQVLERLYEAAQANAAPVGALADLFGKAAQASDNLGASQEELLKFSSGVATALRVAGTSAGQASGSLTQLGQLLGQARVQAEEFNSINEGARPILMAVAAGLDAAGGSVSRLKTLVTEGKVSGQQFFQAFLRGLPEIEGMAANATQTIDQGMTKVNNAFMRYIGQTDESLGATQRLVAALNALADNFDTVADTTLKLAGILAGALLGRAIGGMIAAVPGATAAIGALVMSLRAGALAGATFSAAMGPIGLVLGAATAAFYLLRDSQTDAERATLAHEEALRVLDAELGNTEWSSSQAVEATRALIQADLEAAGAALRHAQARLTLARAVARDNIDPGWNFSAATPAQIEAAENNPNMARVQDEIAAGEELIADIQARLDDLNASAKAGERVYTSVRTRPAPPPPTTTTITPAGGRGRRSGGGDEFAKEIEQITERTMALQAEAAAQAQINPLVKDYGLAVEKARAEREILLAAEKAGVEVTPQLQEKIEGLAEAYAQASAASEQLKESQQKVVEAAQEMEALRRDVTGGLIKDLIAGKDAADAFADALGKVGDKLIDMALDGLFSGGGGAGGGIFGAIGSALFGGRRAAGGPVSAGRAYVVGERRPELFVPDRNGMILPSIPKTGSGGQGVVYVPYVAELKASDDGQMLGYFRRVASAEVRSQAPNIVGQSVQATNRAMRATKSFGAM